MPDPGVAYLNGLIDTVFIADRRRSARKVRYKDVEAEMDPELEMQSSAASGRAHDEYEEQLIGEARAIVDGASVDRPTVEHLRVLLRRLPVPRCSDEAPF